MILIANDFVIWLMLCVLLVALANCHVFESQTVPDCSPVELRVSSESAGCIKSPGKKSDQGLLLDYIAGK